MSAATEYRYNRLTWPEMNEAIELQKVILLPTGSTEQLGLHLPHDVDVFLAESIFLEVGRRLPDKVLVLPPIAYGLNLHHIDFQFNYMLKGWCRVELEGEGIFRFEEGDTWLQPPAIKHNFLECSPDCEILEICSPGNFETIEA